MDGRRFPAQTGAPRSMARSIYSRNLRPVVIAIGGLSALWTLLWAISSFQDVNLDKDNNFPNLANFSIALGAMYTLTCVIEVFGVFAAVTQRLPLVKAYAGASVVSGIVVTAASLMGVVVHFIDKNDIIKECTKVSTGSTLNYRFGLFGSSSQDTLSQSEAAAFCQDGWDHASWSNIISLLFEIFLGILFSVIAIAYYRQLLDPTSAANAFRAPSNRMRGNLYPDHYNPPYNASVPNLGYGSGPSAYAPPPGPPPQFGAGYSAEDINKPPGYDRGEYKDSERNSKENPFADYDGSVEDAKTREHEEFHV